MLQWAIELSEYGIEFQPRLSMKGQGWLTSCWNTPEEPTRRKEPSRRSGGLCGLMEPPGHQDPVVGSYCNPQQGRTSGASYRLGFPHPNNEAEYEKEYEAKDERMARYLNKVRNTLQCFTEWMIEKIKRTEKWTCRRPGRHSASLPSKKPYLLPIHVQTNPSVAEASTCQVPLRQTSSGRPRVGEEDIIRYLRTGTLPEEPKQDTRLGYKLPVSP
ncbi:hypothetical protein CK203_021923 [Vitis vinifera]|uniref:Uncharacterized protein n=1 Tax=Vitis vinifera TaxID=29760 RepID=A0A438JFW1_VITVI|nr:hypothetical protein CK203_021923 [Vitis vinifera]